MENDLVNLYNTLEKQNKIIAGFLKQNGITDEEISFSAPNIIDTRADRYSNVVQPFRYNATGVVTVTSKNVTQVQKLITTQVDLLKSGIAIVTDDYQYRTQYLFTGLNAIKPQMIAVATANARLAAVKFAQDSGSKLGKIKAASQGQFSIMDSNNYTPQIKSVRVVTTIQYYLKD